MKTKRLNTSDKELLFTFICRELDTIQKFIEISSYPPVKKKYIRKYNEAVTLLKKLATQLQDNSRIQGVANVHTELIQDSKVNHLYFVDEIRNDYLKEVSFYKATDLAFIYSN